MTDLDGKCNLEFIESRIGMPEMRGSNRRADANRRREPLSGGYYWFPTQDHGSVTWRVLTCHELGFGDEVGHDAMWPTVLQRSPRLGVETEKPLDSTL